MMPLRGLGAAVLGVPLGAAVLASTWFPGDPREPSGQPFLPPGAQHLLGTDDLGRDLLAALAHGGQASLLTGTVVTLGAALLGVGIGVVAGLAPPGIDRLLVRLTDLSQIVPRFFLALLAGAWLGPGWLQLAVILALTGWATLARLVRAEARSLRHAPFIDAARLLGAGPASIALRHIVPNVMPVALPQLPLVFASALLIEAGLSFLGAGDPNRLSWGQLIQAGQAHALRAWWLAFFPGMTLALASLGLSLLALGARAPQNEAALGAG
ncbi:MAG: ABC transporter permease [Burkholderiaceae bacterium]